MITKDKAIEVIKSLPEEFSIEELMDRLILPNKIETGLRQTERGESFTTDQAKKMVKTSH